MGKTNFDEVVVDSMLLTPGSSDPTEAGEITFVSGTGFRAYTDSGVITLGSGGGGSALGDLDGVYSNGQEITLDEGAIVLTDSTTGSLNSLELVKDGAGSGNVIDISIDAALTGKALAIDMNLGIAATAIYLDRGATARTGADNPVNDYSAGNHSVIDINTSGSGTSVGFDWTNSYNGSDASVGVKLTLDNADGIDATAIQIVRGTGIRTAPAIDINDASTGSAHIIDIDLTGVFTGNIFDFASSAAATGNVININLDSAVAMTAIHVEGSGVRTQPMIEVATDATGSSDVIDIAITGAISGNVIDVDMGAAVTGNVIDIDMNLALGSKGIYIDAGNGTRTADLIGIKHDGDGNIDVMAIVASNTGTGSIFDINMDGIGSTGGVFNIDMNAAVGATVMTIDAGAGTRTVDMIDVTFDGDGNVGFLDINVTNTGSGNIIDIDIDSVHTGNIIDITYGTAAATGDALAITMGTNVAGTAIAISGTGARTDDLIKIDSDQTGTGLVFDINMTGAGSGNVIDITYATAANTGDALAITMGTNLAGSAIVLSGTGLRTDDLIKIDSDDTSASHDFDINLSGVGSGNCIDITYSVGADTGNAIDLNMGTNVAGMAISVASAATGTSGEGACFDVEHTGNLAAGADCVTIHSTGSPSSTSNLLSIEQDTGAGTAGAYGLYINCTGANVEALKVDAGNVVFDENLAVGGTLTITGATTLTGAVTAAAGVQSASVARTATADGTGDGTIADGTSFVTVTSDSADKIITLPTPTPGNIVHIYVGDTGFELRSSAPATIAINGGSEANAESAVSANTLVKCVCTSSTTWVCNTFSSDGTEAKLEAAAAA
jgi:hypothetical protein